MERLLSACLMMLASLPALAQDGAVGNDTPAAEASTDKADSATKADEAKPGDEEFKPPPGFKTKKRGELVLYCMRDSTVGTRFKTEKCYDETQMREYLLALEVQKRDIDRIRSTCATGSVCAPR
jgi:hypothetical protein